MAINYSWKISSLDVSKTHEQYQDLVLNVHWRIVATDDIDEVQAELFGVDSLSEPQDSSSFISLESLSKEIVVSWVEQKLSSETLENGSTRLDEIMNHLQQQIEEKRQPKIEQIIPSWE